MAICEVCEQEMTTAPGCTGVAYLVQGREYARLAFGQERDMPASLPHERCHDCGCWPGRQHHPGCDMEECPLCHGQLISCECLDDDAEVLLEDEGGD
ncbi:MAG: hypothetical protein NVSMB65_07770 [Chloroflexota bacterium]